MTNYPVLTLAAFMAASVICTALGSPVVPLEKQIAETNSELSMSQHGGGCSPGGTARTSSE